MPALTTNRDRLATASAVAVLLLAGCGASRTAAGPAPARAPADAPAPAATAEALPTNPGLELALAGASAHDTPEYRQQLFRELLGSRLIVPSPVAGPPLPPGRVAVAAPGARLSFVALAATTGETAMAVFTSAAAFGAWAPDGARPVVAASSEVFAAALESKCDGVVVNPAGPVRGTLSRPIVAALADGLLPEGWDGNELRVTVASTGSRVIGPATAPDAALVTALRTRSAALPDVLATYLVEARTPGAEPTLVIAMDLAPGADPQPVVQAIGEAIRPRIDREGYVDILILTPGEASSEAVRRQGPAVFAR